MKKIEMLEVAMCIIFLPFYGLVVGCAITAIFIMEMVDGTKEKDKEED